MEYKQAHRYGTLLLEIFRCAEIIAATTNVTTRDLSMCGDHRRYYGTTYRDPRGRFRDERG